MYTAHLMAAYKHTCMYMYIQCTCTSVYTVSTAADSSSSLRLYVHENTCVWDELLMEEEKKELRPNTPHPNSTKMCTVDQNLSRTPNVVDSTLTS